MNWLKIGILAGLGVIGGSVISGLQGQAVPAPRTVEDARAIIRELRPFSVVSGQVTEKFQALYIIDHEARRLTVMKYEDPYDRLTRVGNRDLGQDFNAPEGGPYAQTTVQLSNSRGLLYVTDNASRKVIAYKIDLVNNSVNLLTSIDLSRD